MFQENPIWTNLQTKLKVDGLILTRICIKMLIQAKMNHLAKVKVIQIELIYKSILILYISLLIIIIKVSKAT